MTNPKSKSSKSSIVINKTTLEELTKTISDLNKTDQPQDDTKDDVDPSDLAAVLNLLIQTVTVLTNHIKSLSPNTIGGTGEVSKEVADKIREQEDELDESRQRSLHGNLIITSQNQSNKVSLIKFDQQLQQENLTLADHTIQLVKEKFDVVLSLSDIQACHRMPNNSIILRIWNRRNDSAWSQIVDSIKSGKNMGYNVFFNFHLTRRRSTLLYNMRQLKKSGDNSKFYSDENGQLTVMVRKKEEGGVKRKVTYYAKERNSPPKTLGSYGEQSINYYLKISSKYKNKNFSFKFKCKLCSIIFSPKNYMLHTML